MINRPQAIPHTVAQPRRPFTAFPIKPFAAPRVEHSVVKAGLPNRIQEAHLAGRDD